MKNIFFLFIAVLFSANLFAQPGVTPEILAKVKKAQKTYNFDESQTIEYRKIATRYDDNLASIRDLETSDPDLYQQKMMALLQGNEFSVKRLLNAEQLKIYQAEKLERRKQRAAFVSQLKNEGKSKEEMKKALVEWQLAQ